MVFHFKFSNPYLYDGYIKTCNKILVRSNLNYKLFFLIIGLHQTQPRGPWVWHNFEHVGFTKWDKGHPVNTKWRSPTNKQIKRKYYLSQKQKHYRGPKACVLVTPHLYWQNRLCNRIITNVNFICMRNPEIF